MENETMSDPVERPQEGPWCPKGACTRPRGHDGPCGKFVESVPRPQEGEATELYVSFDGCPIQAISWRDGELCLRDADEVPEPLQEDAPPGLSVFDGIVRQPTKEEDPKGYYDSWWEGSLRPATVDEVLALFRPASPQGYEGLAEGLPPGMVQEAIKHLQRMMPSASLEEGLALSMAATALRSRPQVEPDRDEARVEIARILREYRSAVRGADGPGVQEVIDRIMVAAAGRPPAVDPGYCTPGLCSPSAHAADPEAPEDDGPVTLGEPDRFAIPKVFRPEATPAEGGGEGMRELLADVWRIGTGVGVTHDHDFDYWWNHEGEDRLRTALSRSPGGPIRVEGNYDRKTWVEERYMAGSPGETPDDPMPHPADWSEFNEAMRELDREEQEAFERDPVGCTANVLDQLVAQAEAGNDILPSLRELGADLHRLASAPVVEEEPDDVPTEKLTAEARAIGRAEGCSECVDAFHPETKINGVTSRNPVCPIRRETCVRFRVPTPEDTEVDDG